MKEKTPKSTLHLLAAEDAVGAQLTIKYLLRSKQYRVDERAQNGVTPLHVAAAADNLVTCQLLLSFGADPLLPDEHGRTPYDVAVGKTRCFFKQNFRKSNQSQKRMGHFILRAFRTLFSCGLYVKNGSSLDLRRKSSWSLSRNLSNPDHLYAPEVRVPISATTSEAATKCSSFLKVPIVVSQTKDAGFGSMDSLSSLDDSFVTARKADERSFDMNKPYKLSLPSSISGNELPYISHKESRQVLESTETTFPVPSVVSHLTDNSDSSSDTGETIPSDVLLEVSHMPDRQLKQEFAARGISIGPLLYSTRSLYQKKLARLIADIPSCSTKSKKYSTALEEAIGGIDFFDLGRKLDEILILDFSTMISQSCREGKRATSFCYILIDPLLIDDAYTCTLETFVRTIFYIGKGKRSRPLEHLVEAARCKHLRKAASPKAEESAKVNKIKDVWSSGRGVVSLHVFQNTIPVEAFTREAAMIDAIGLKNLTNVRRGDYYGKSKVWSLREKTVYGSFLLARALNVFRVEGSRQLFKHDVMVS